MCAYRKLTEREISQLELQGCRADDWCRVLIAGIAAPERIYRTSFSGDVFIGNPDSDNPFTGEIRDCHIRSCRIGNIKRLASVDWLADYDIGDNVIMEAVEELSMQDDSSFGNGMALDILNEAGGRELICVEDLTAQIAYIQVMYRHDEDFSSRLAEMMKNYAASRRSARGSVGDSAVLRHCRTLRNVKIGDFARVDGANRLTDGSVVSCEDAPVFIGSAVVADHFIIQEGSSVDSGVILDKCFVGQGVRIGKQYSAENSAFFANCEAFHGEACSVFAGPYTVTHHKSSLLIAGLYSFYNAGSGTNMSNHMYKLGPVHQSILERGSKTGSFSYMLAPSRVGAFSAVIGKHYTNFDASAFPFSYITEEEGKSYLTPAMNILTVGTRRDSQKWPKRDRRIGLKRDLLHFPLFSPPLLHGMQTAHELLMKLYGETARDREELILDGLHLRRLMLKTSAKYYELGLKVACAELLGQKLDSLKDSLPKPELLLKHQDGDYTEKWVDMSGLFCCASRVTQIMADVRDTRITALPELIRALTVCSRAYDEDAWTFTAALICHRLQKNPAQVSSDDLRTVLDDGAQALVKLNNLIRSDAGKEFDDSARIGYGIDGDDSVRDNDFQAVRGDFETNGFVQSLSGESEAMRQKVEAWKARL